MPPWLTELHNPLTPPGWLVRILRPIIHNPYEGAMLDTEA